MPWATAASVGGSLLSGAMGSSSAKKEASKARQMAREAIARQEAAKVQIGADLAPYVNSGSQSQNKLNYLLGSADEQGKQHYSMSDFLAYNQNALKAMGFKNSKIAAQAQSDAAQQYQAYLDGGMDNTQAKAQYGFRDLVDKPLDTSDGQYGSLLKPFTNEDFVKDPGYTFRQLEGQKAVDNGQLARGGFDSGAALKELNRYTQDYASNEFNNAFTRDNVNKQNTFNFLSGDANRGLSATGTKANAFLGAANAQNAAAQNGQNTSSQLMMQGNEDMANGITQSINNLLYGLNRNKTDPYGGNTPYIPGGYSSVPKTTKNMFVGA